MIIAIISILIITLAVWLINKKLSFKICPICAGVSLTWLWLLLGIWFGFLSVSRYEIIIAILMGASIGGIVTELKKILLKFREKNKLSQGQSLREKEIEEKMKDCC